MSICTGLSGEVHHAMLHLVCTLLDDGEGIRTFLGVILEPWPMA